MWLCCLGVRGGLRLTGRGPPTSRLTPAPARAMRVTLASELPRLWATGAVGTLLRKLLPEDTSNKPVSQIPRPESAEATGFQFVLFGRVTACGGDVILFGSSCLGWAALLSLTSPSIGDVTAVPLLARTLPEAGPLPAGPTRRGAEPQGPPACPSPSHWVSAGLTACKATVS